MILTLALRSLLAHPVRSAVLAAGFGFGVAVMAILLGVGQVVLEQARSPELAGGGDVLVTGTAGELTAARVLLASTLAHPPFEDRVRAASPWARTMLRLVDVPGSPAVRARGGVPSLERALGDREIAGQDAWVDATADLAWSSPAPGDVLRAIDRFHPVPDVEAWGDSWAEWLYFNGQAGATRFYLTFMVGPRTAGSRRGAGVRLQLERGGRVESFTAGAELDEEEVARAPELTIAGNRVRLDGIRYRIALDLADRSGRRASGEIVIEGSPARLLPPIEIHGAKGWLTGYVVPVMSGTLDGALVVGSDRVDLSGGRSYHDHNWGFWEGVSWQWGQVQHEGLSIVYGRVFPPAEAADPDRMPGLLGVLGPDGPLGYTTGVSIEEFNDASGRPERIVIDGRGGQMDLSLAFRVESAITTPRAGGAAGASLDFLQMRGEYEVRGRVGDRAIAFRAPGAAETFRGR